MGPVVSGGVDIITMNYFRNIDKNKVQLDFIFDGFFDTKLDEEITINGSKIFKVYPYSKNLLKSMYEIYRVVKDNDYDIVHSHMNSLSVFPLFAAKLGGAKIRIASSHSASSSDEVLKTSFKNILRPLSKIFPTHYAACSDHAARWLFGDSCVESGKVKLIKNAIELENFKFSDEVRQLKRKELGIEDNFVLGHIGRFAVQKNHQFLLKILEEIVSKNDKTILVLVGEGAEKIHIEKLVKEKNLMDNVLFLGLREDVPELMQAFDVFVFPSLYEGLGNVITEAQAASTQSIVSEAIPDEIKLTEYVDTLSLNDSVEVWSSKIMSYSAGYSRRNTFLDLSENGYEIKMAAKELEAYYNEILRS